MFSYKPPTAAAVPALFYGNARPPLAVIIPDGRYAGMFRIAWPDGRLGDIVNLSRAKDAAAAIAERGPPARDRSRFNWKQDRSKPPIFAPPVRRNGQAAVKPRLIGAALPGEAVR